MSRARYDTDLRQTAAADEIRGSGCLSSYVLTPVAVLLISILLAAFAINAPVQSASLQSVSIQSANIQTVPESPASLARIFTPEVQYWSSSISRWAVASALDPDLVAVIMQIESCGNPSAHSSAGAIGLFQVMPYHFFISDDPYDPDTNAARGLSYLKRSLSAASNNPRLALAGYNGGISQISISAMLWPAETTRYVYWGTGIYDDASNSAAQSPRLTEWLSAGGASLCAQARQRLGISG
jgi:soluble lytic murein transglycosylase-like protein